MKINFEAYNHDWPFQFESLKKEIHSILNKYEPKIEHFGSTAVPGLSAKPVIDILVGIEDISQFSSIVELMLQHEAYIHYQVYDDLISNRRLFVRLKDGIDDSSIANVMDDFDTIPHEKIIDSRMAHVHVWKFNSPDWIRHIAFRDYLLAHEDVRNQYGEIKKELAKKDWPHGMKYNDGKNAFIKAVEAKAIIWHNQQK